VIRRIARRSDAIAPASSDNDGVNDRAVQLICAVLAVAAVAETLGRTADTGIVVVALCLVALGTTVPAAVLPPIAAAAAGCVMCVLSVALFHTLTVAALLAQLLAGYRLGRGGAQLTAAVLAIPYLVFALADAHVRTHTILLAALAPMAAWSGSAHRARIESARHAQAREAIAGTLVEHTARGERARISRELHDVVAHHISMIAVQAETARLATPGMPAAGAQRLSAIGDTARAALTEMRRLLGVLREDTEPVAEREPQPGLDQLGELLDAARDASGAGTRLILRGAPIRLDPGVELAAFRIAQEALTNVRRHAPGAAVDVELTYAADRLWLCIRDNGPGPGEIAGGHGLLGMHERASAVGGRLTTRAAAGGGFLVEAWLPTDTSPQAETESTP
jgi:signal transduction histidine kinase